MNQGILFLKENIELKQIILDAKNEINSAIRSAIINNSFDKDIDLSFGTIHINPQGSISTISFEGEDVNDLDSFAVTKALKVKHENYFDIRRDIKYNPDKFIYFPIKGNDDTNFTVLKYSPFFIEKFGTQVFNHDEFIIEYTLKYIVIKVLVDYKWETYVFRIETLNQYTQVKCLLKGFERKYSLNKELYFAFLNTKPEFLMMIGEFRDDFKSINKKNNLYECIKYYKSTIAKITANFLKVNDEKNEPIVDESFQRIIANIIDIKYGNASKFSNIFNLNVKDVRDFISGKSPYLVNKNKTRLSKNDVINLLNLDLEFSANKLKKKNLLTPIEYEDIPERPYNEE